jgi:threonine/homoserine/homoserine lactone efflux protein
MEFVSGILNPKNALFYASLAAMLTGPYASAGWKTVYGLWMFGIVLLWDMLIALTIGNRAVLQRFTRALPWLERISGITLILLALGMLIVLAAR